MIRCKRLKFDQADKCYMHKPEIVVENETHKILWDSEIKKKWIIQSRPEDQI